jgi:hypothetical protein
MNPLPCMQPVEELEQRVSPTDVLPLRCGERPPESGRNEVADFVITTPQRVLHPCQGISRRDVCSASALPSQAIKKLPRWQPMSVLPMDRSRWKRHWTAPRVKGTIRHLDLEPATRNEDL